MKDAISFLTVEYFESKKGKNYKKFLSALHQVIDQKAELDLETIRELSNIMHEAQDKEDEVMKLILGVLTCCCKDKQFSLETSDNLTSDIPKAIYKHMKEVEGIKRPRRNLDLVLEKLSQNKHDLKCANGDDIFARAFSRNLHYTEIEDVFLGAKLQDEGHCDFNAVTITYNPYSKRPEKMTILE